MKVRSFAKINMGLEVLRKREDNYHEIRTLFQAIDFYDVLEFQPISQNKILLKSDDDTISWGGDNLIYQTALLLKERFSLSNGIEVFIEKNIPAGKGLGGGSSNAAMTLYALNKIWRLNQNKKDLMNFGKELGADVSYFLEGGLCLGVGRGDEIIPLRDYPPCYCLCILPELSILTASVYKQLRLSLTLDNKESKISKFLENRDFDLLENNLEDTVFLIHPQLLAIKSLIQSLGSELSLVSGSGAAVFGLFLKKEKAKKAHEELKKKYPLVFVKTLSRDLYWKSISVGV
ncbi:4-(cytidine 5'-diphospho)-2-C-methyl-D-erythritol kinase [Acidobacteriota bacterium]